MNFRFHPEASAEYEADIRYYKRRQPGLQHRFVAAVEEAIAKILEHPERWRMIEPEIRRCLTNTFPTWLSTPFKRHDHRPRNCAWKPRARLLEASH